MTKLGYTPRRLSFVGVDGFEDGSSYDFALADSKLRNRGFMNIPQITINAAPPPVLDIPGVTEQWGLHVLASLQNRTQKNRQNSMVWAWEGKETLSRDMFLNVITSPHRMGLIDYAFAFRDFSCNLPANEAVHSPFVGRLNRKGGVISSQGYSTKQVYEMGRHPLDFLREVHPYQILNPIHLAYKLGSQTLREWIESISTHGWLEPFSEDRWLWSVPEDTIQSVRQTLAKNHLLTLYLPDMNRILEDYENPPC